MRAGMHQPMPPPRLALVGDRSDSVQAHSRIPAILTSLASGSAEPVEPYWLPTTAIETADDVAGFDGIWVVPGSPYESMDGVLVAIRTAREKGLPLLGTCGGFQHILIEYARHVCRLERVTHAEVEPAAEQPLVVPLACDLFGEESTVIVRDGTLAAAVMGAGPSTERYFCRYGLDPSYEGVLAAHGLVVSGRDSSGEARIVELPGHPYLVGTLFQPELSSDSTWVHPLIRAFIGAVRAQAAAAHDARAVTAR